MSSKARRDSEIFKKLQDYFEDRANAMVMIRLTNLIASKDENRVGFGLVTV